LFKKNNFTPKVLVQCEACVSEQMESSHDPTFREKEQNEPGSHEATHQRCKVCGVGQIARYASLVKLQGMIHVRGASVWYTGGVDTRQISEVI